MIYKCQSKHRCKVVNWLLHNQNFTPPQATNPSPTVHEAPLGNPNETVTSSHFKLSKLFLQLLDINKIRSSFSSFSKLPKLNNTDITMFIGSAFQKLHI